MNPLSLLPWWVQALIVAALIAAAYAAVAAYDEHQREIGRDEIRAEWSKDRERQKDEAIKTAQANAKETLRRSELQQGAQDDRNKKLEVAQHDAARARSESEQLRHDAELFAAATRGASCNPAAGADGASAGSSAGVLADVLGRVSQRAEVLAQYADAARIAGQQCEASYDALKPAH